MKKAIVSVINDLSTDQRVDRTCISLRKLDFDVLLVGRQKRNSFKLNERNYRTFRFKMIFEKGFLFYAFYNIRLFFLLLFSKTDLLFSNDLDTLLPNYLVSKIKNIPLVYDSHEYFTEVPELTDRPFIQNIWRRIEATIFPKLENIITVNHSIAKLYNDKYHKKLTVVRNIPLKIQSDKVKSRREISIPENKQIIILQGAGINIQRGAEEAMEAMQYIEDAILLIVGAGDVIPSLKEKAKQQCYLNKVMFVPKQPFSELYHYTANADLGLTLDKDTNINYRYSLPNKLFDYIHAGVPILASPLAEVKQIIEEFQIGEIIENHEPLLIANKIKSMLSDPAKQEIWKKNLKIASDKLNWDSEEIILLNILKKYA